MIKIVFEEENNRSAAYEGDIFAGECTISPSDNFWIIDHTGVEEGFERRGIGAMLVAKVVEQARKNNVKILPLCPFAKREFEKKQEYSDILFTGGK